MTQKRVPPRRGSFGGPHPWRSVVRVGLAAVWLHQGLWCKVLNREPSHRAVIASVPGLPAAGVPSATTAIGLGETALAALVAARGDRRWVAAVQTAIVGSFNAGGLIVGRDHIEDPARLLVRNGIFVALIWSSVDGRPH